MKTGRSIFAALSLILLLILTACVPESDLERASGGGGADNDDYELTPIAEEGLPDVRELELRVLGIDVRRRAGQVSAEISLGAGTDARVEFAGIAEVEWSDGRTTDALPVAGAEMRVETRRSDPDGDVEPVSLRLTGISYLAETDVHGEITPDEIVTAWGSFPVLSTEQVARPPGWEITYQAAGQRWISRIEVIHDGRHRPADGTTGAFDDGFRPVTGSLRFGLEYEDFRDDLPLVARVDIRVAVPEISVDL